MTREYSAILTTTAVVQIRVRVLADSQAEAMVEAQDAVLNAKLADMTIISADTSEARLQSIAPYIGDTDASTPVSNPSMLTLTCFELKDSKGDIWSVVRKHWTLEEAKAEATQLLAGSVEIRDDANVLVFKLNNPRGGWEVEQEKSEGVFVLMHTWLPDFKEASRLAVNLLREAPSARLKIFDCTDKKLGRQLWATLS